MKLLYVGIGWTAVILGSIGVILPVLPTTPFLLLAAWCFAKSSPKFHRWLTDTKMYQTHLQSFVEHRSMTRKTKFTLLSFASAMLLAAMYFMEAWYLRLFLLFLIIFKYYYFFFKIRTIPSKTV